MFRRKRHTPRRRLSRLEARLAQLEPLEPRCLLAALIGESRSAYLGDLAPAVHAAHSDHGTADDGNELLDPLPGDLPAFAMSSFEPLEPLGSLAYRSTVSGTIETSETVTAVPLELQTGQQITVVIQPDPGLLSVIVLQDPDGQFLAQAISPSTGRPAILQSVSVPSNGVYGVMVSSAEATTGSFAGSILLNSAIELEGLTGIDNSDFLSAQDLDNSFVSLGTLDSERAYVVGARGHDYDEDFESPVLNAEWTTSSTDLGGRIRISKQVPAANGLGFLLMDREELAVFTRNEATWTVDLSDVTTATLRFSHVRFGDEPHPLPASFSSTFNGDGVSVSQDGVRWHTILSSPQTPNGEWTPFEIDLAAFAASAGIELDRDFLIKFQQFDDGSFNSDGRGFDAIMIETNPLTSVVDWYQVSLQDGQHLSLALADYEFSLGSSLHIYDSQFQLLATSSGSENATQVIADFRDTTANQSPDLYRIRVSSPAENYGLLMTRNTSFDREHNSSLSSSQDVTATTDALGFVTEQAGTSLRLRSSFAGPPYTGFIPPDPTLAVGPAQVVGVVNSRIAVYDKQTGRELFSQNLHGPTGFWGSVGSRAVAFDPWVLYDTDSGRFFLVAVDNESSTVSNLYIAVSINSTPSRGSHWHKYKVDFTHHPPDHLGTGPHFADYPKIGVNDDAIFISGNYFPINVGNGIYAGITAFKKAPLLAGQPLNIAYQEFFDGLTVFPLHQYDSGSVQYFTEVIDRGQLRVHAISNVLTTPTRETIEVSVPDFDLPRDVPQLGGGSPVSAIDTRIMSGVWRNGSAWIAHSVTDPAILDGETVVRWYELATNDFPVNQPSLVQSGNVDPGPNRYAWMPAISVDASGNMGLGFAVGGPGEHPGAGFTGRLKADPEGTTALPVQQLVTGQGNYELLDGSSRNRWGDYAGLAIDPSDDATFWVFHEYSTPLGRWDTRIGSFQLDPVPDSDWYSFEVNLGDVLTIATSTPFDGPNVVSNDPNVDLELYSPEGVLLAADANSATDGRNARITHTADGGGRYHARVLTTGSTGVYELKIEGATGAVTGPAVIASNPGNGQVVRSFPSTYTLITSRQIAAPSMEPNDLTVNGIPATAVEVRGNSLVFTLDPAASVGEGPQVVSLSRDSITDYQGNMLVTSYDGSFTVDTIAIAVTGTNWNDAPLPADRVLSTGMLNFSANLSELPFRLASARRGLFAPGADDIILTETSTGVTVNETAIDLNTTTNVFRATYGNLAEGTYDLRLVSGPGAFTDEAGNPLDGEPNPASHDGTPTGDGNPGGDFLIRFYVDRPTVESQPFLRAAPVGTLVSRSLHNRGYLHGTADDDALRFFAHAGETIAANATFDQTVSGTLRLTGESEIASTTSASSGGNLFLAPVTIPADGVYKLWLSATGPAHFDVDLWKNADAEISMGDSSTATPLAIDDSLVSLGGGRYALVGQSVTGFRFDSSHDPSTWLDISATGVPLNLRDDDEVSMVSTVGNAAFPAGDITVGNNGGIMAGRFVNLYFQNLFLPAPDIGTALFAYWDDLGESLRNVYVEQVTLDGKPTLIVQWEQMPHFETGGDISFQLQLFGSGEIFARYVYKDVIFGNPAFDRAANATIGFQQEDGPYALVSLNTVSVNDGDVLDLVIDPDVDEYTIDLSASVGKKIDIGLTGLAGVDFSAERLELLDPLGTVVATASFHPLDAVATNFDLAILDHQLASVGNNVYRLRLTSRVDGEYGLAVAESLMLDVEPNESADILRPVSPGVDTLGYLSGLDPRDWVLMRLNAGDHITLGTSTPFDSPTNSPANSLDPELALLDSDRTTVLAEDQNSGDGKNAQLTFTAPTTGDYFIRVSATTGTGEYLLRTSIVPLPTLTISDFSQVEGNADSSLWTITVTRSHNQTDASVDVQTLDGEATADQDYLSLATTIHFAAGGPLTESISITVLGDTEVEPDESFSLVLANSTGALIEDTVSTVTILDDDTPPPPTVASVRVGSSRWDPQFATYIDADLNLGYVLPNGVDQLATLPWTNLDRIFVQFTSNVQIGLDDIRLVGVRLLDYSTRITGLIYHEDTQVAEIQLSSGIPADKLLLRISDDVTDIWGSPLDGDWVNGESTGNSGNGTVGGDFAFRWNVLPGDADHSAKVTGDDFLSVRGSRNEQMGSPEYRPEYDTNGTGFVNGDDIWLARYHRFSTLPVSEPEVFPVIPDPEPEFGFLVDPDVGIPGDRLSKDQIDLFFAKLDLEEPQPPRRQPLPDRLRT